METTLDYGVTMADTLDDARKRRDDAWKRATGPMSVPQPDGSILRRCFAGRLTFAYMRVDDPDYADKRPQVLEAIAEIQMQSNEAWAAFVKAEVEYIGLCSVNGVQPTPRSDKDCRCDVCSILAPPTVRLVAMVAS